MKAGILVLLIFFVASGMASADVYNDSIYSEEKILTLTVESSVKGDGYYKDYQYIKMDNVLEPSEVTSNGVQAKNYAHGSGNLDSESLLSAVSNSSTFGATYNAELMDYQMAFSSIQMNEDNKIVYSPTTMGVGSRFYNLHPVKFNSLLKEENLIKNRGGGNWMQNGVEYAHSLDKKLDTLVNVFEDVNDPSITSMNVSENVTEGRAHIGVLQANPDAISEIETNPETGEEETFAFAKSAWRKPQIYVDEDYLGNFHIEKKMNIAAEVADDDYTDDYDWLPCTCNSGWDDMDLHDTRYHSAKGFFDCTACPTHTANPKDGEGRHLP